MELYYQFGSDDYVFELTYKQVREAVADICSNNKTDKDIIKDFINKSDLEYECFLQYKDELKEYFEDDARQRWQNDCDDDEYWENTDIHGGV